MDVTDHTQSQDSLILYKLGRAAKPEVLFSLEVHSNLSWQLTYHNKKLSASVSGFLKEVPLVFSATSDVVKLLQMLDSCHTCVGNHDINLSRSVFMNAAGYGYFRQVC